MVLAKARENVCLILCIAENCTGGKVGVWSYDFRGGTGNLYFVSLVVDVVCCSFAKLEGDDKLTASLSQYQEPTSTQQEYPRYVFILFQDDVIGLPRRLGLPPFSRTT